MSGHDAILFHRVRVQGRLCDVLVADGHIVSVGEAVVPTGTAPTDAAPGEVIDGDGAALLPGLHDHHLHLAALAASLGSVDVGPPTVTTPEQFAAALARADAALPAGRWIRAVGYHESVAGPLDRDLLDRLVPRRPTRVQDRTGLRWTLNSAGLDLAKADEAPHPGIARDEHGRPTGAVDRGDEWIRTATGGAFPDLAPVGRTLAALGVTGVTDCTPYDELSGPSAIAAAVDAGVLPQRVYVTGGVGLADRPLPSPLHTGPVKILLDEPSLPELSQLVAAIAHAHRADRNVAVHVVTAATLAFALAAWHEAGAHPGDRIEHGSVITPAAIDPIAALGLTVVTQPAFVAERGDRYLAEVEDDHDDLYRCATLLARGVPVAGSSDAPYALPDPWRAIDAAVTRRTSAGAVLGADERLPLERAYALFTGDPLDPGRRHRRIEPGAPADLVLLGRPLDRSRPPSAADVRATYVAGRPI
ncbi:MAG: amidohydrolase family protein [Actinomycetota bacterium]|nr:amidohydrolase family protein [Actinomycetota bacterium]